MSICVRLSLAISSTTVTVWKPDRRHIYEFSLPHHRSILPTHKKRTHSSLTFHSADRLSFPSCLLSCLDKLNFIHSPSSHLLLSKHKHNRYHDVEWTENFLVSQFHTRTEMAQFSLHFHREITEPTNSCCTPTASSLKWWRKIHSPMMVRHLLLARWNKFTLTQVLLIYFMYSSSDLSCSSASTMKIELETSTRNKREF